MDCLEIRKCLLPYVDHELPEGQEREIFLHLEACPCCRRRARYEERFRLLLRDRLAPSPPPSGLRERVRARLAAEELAGPAHPRRRLLLHPAPLAALLLSSIVLLAVSGGVLAFRQFSGNPAGGTVVRLAGRLVCLRCEREGVPMADQRKCLAAGHFTGLRTRDGRLLTLAGSGTALLQGDPGMRGREVEVEGILDAATGTLELRGHRLP